MRLLPKAADWKTKLVDLSQFTGSSSVRFAISSFSYSSGNNALYIDNVAFKDSASVSVGGRQPYQKEIKVYPNPAKDILQISTGKHSVNKISIYNTVGVLVGQLVISNPKELHTINTSKLNSGVYIVKVEGDNIDLNTRVFITR